MRSDPGDAGQDSAAQAGILTVERAMRALVKLARGCELEQLTAADASGLESEGSTEAAAVAADEAAQQILPWMAAVWAKGWQGEAGESAALPQMAAQLASVAPWAEGAVSLPPTLRLRCLLAMLAAHCHLVAGPPTEGGLWLWRFISGEGGKQLTTLLPGEIPTEDSAMQQVQVAHMFSAPIVV